MDVAAAALPAFVALWLLYPWPLLGSALGQFSAGGCTFDDGPGACDYHQDLYDDFEWVHVSAQEPHYLPPEMPQGSYMVVDSSNHDPGEKARLQLPTMKENDTHCIDFSYLLYSQKGLNPGTLNILVRVNKGPLANPIWNVTGFTGRDWLRAELAVSTFWPNEYQQGEQNTHRRKYGNKLWSRDLRKGHPDTAPSGDPSHIQPPNLDPIVDAGKCLLIEA